jgi:hypothetical protein
MVLGMCVAALAVAGCARVEVETPAEAARRQAAEAGVASEAVSAAGHQVQRDGPIAWPDEVDDVAYPLDGYERKAPGSGKPDCPDVQLVDYAGDAVKYHRPLKVSPFFRERLLQFEMVVKEVGARHYGRPPSAIVHYGAFNCRRISGRAKLSEHALGNALDVAGFAFDADPMLPGPLGEDLRVDLLEHWRATDPIGAHHADFLHDLARELAARPDIFRGMLGPGAAGHENHFHLDVGVWRYLTMEAVR